MKTVTMYRTKDGKLHGTKKKAQDHELDLCRELIDNFTRPVAQIGKGFVYTEFYRFINRFIGDNHELTRDTINELASILNYDDANYYDDEEN